jgi:hypothetical protein
VTRTKSASSSAADVALLGVVCTALIFQALRQEAYEAEKLGFLVMFSGWIIGYYLNRRLSWPVLSNYFRNPIVIGMVGVAASAVLSTLFSLSPTRSLWGSADRSFGLLTIFVGIVIFWQSAHCSEQAKRAIFQALCLITLPVCFLALFQYYFSEPAFQRPVSTAGNTNYLAAWLVMVLAYVIPQIAGKSWIHAPRRWLLLGAGWLLLVLATLIITGSRASILGLVFASVGGVLLFCRISGRRRLLILTLLGLLAAVGLGIVVSQQVSQEVRIAGIGRIFSTQDNFRILFWEESLHLIAEMSNPLYSANQMPDPSAALRPVLGYGLDSVEHLRVRYQEVVDAFNPGALVNRMHSLGYDTILSVGWLGWLAHMFLYQAAYFVILSKLGLIKKLTQFIPALILQVLGALATLIITLAFGVHPGAAVVLTSVGAVAGLFLWVVLQTLRLLPAAPPTEDKPWFWIAIFCVVIHHFVNNQFGFPQIVTQTLWWVFLGLAVRESSGNNRPISKTDSWPGYKLVLVTGLFTSYSLTRVIPLEMLALFLFLFGVCSLVWLASQEPLRIKTVITIIAGVATYCIILNAFRLQVALATNALLRTGGITPATLGSQAQLFSAGGVISTLLCMVIIGPHRWSSPGQIVRYLLPVAVTIGIYSWCHTSTVLQRTANALAQTQGAFDAADLSYQTAYTYFPSNTDVLLDYMTFLSAHPEVRSHYATVSELAQRMLLIEPFANNAATWLFDNDIPLEATR